MATCGTGSYYENSQQSSELRLVLLGNRGAGKTSLANSILNTEEHYLRRSSKCVKRQGEVAGRRLMVVDTPGWWKNHLAKETPSFRKQEIALSVTLCPPGPHAFLLVIRLDGAYKEKNQRSAREHLELLGDGVWKHTVVTFTYGNQLDSKSIERQSGTEGEAHLQWLVERCRNRYLVFNTENKDNFREVAELLEKIEEMVSMNGESYYEADAKIVQGVMRRRQAEEEKANKRKLIAQKQRENQRVLLGQKQCLSKIGLVLLGYRRAGKSSAGNTILGKRKFDLKRTAQCKMRQGEVAGRQLFVVDTPGWWRNLPVKNTPELLQQELLLAGSLCPNVARAFLLVIRSDFSFTEEERQAVEEHMKLFGTEVWDHTILLFTFGDSLEDTTVEQNIASEGKALEWFVEKCGNRYHLLNNENWGDGSQVTELLEKIEEMVAGNGGYRYKMDKKILKEVKKRRKTEEKRAKMRLKEQEKKTKLRSFAGDGHFAVSLVLLGYGEAGKTSTGNTILGSEEFSLTRTCQSVKRQGLVMGRQLTVVDTPGWWKNLPLERTPKTNAREIELSVSLCPPGPYAFLLVLRLDSSFQEEERKAAEEHVELLGAKVWRRTLVLFTCGDWLGDATVEQYIESEGKALRWLIEKCNSRYHVFNNKNRADGSQVAELLEKIEEMASGDCHEMDVQLLRETTVRRRMEEERVEKRGIKL